MKKLIACVLSGMVGFAAVAAALDAPFVAQGNEERIPPFRVGACSLKSFSERHVSDARACGIDCASRVLHLATAELN